MDRLTVRYPTRREPSLIDVSLGVAAGERLGVTGRTGAGKTTLALAAAGFIPRVVRATVAGDVSIDGPSALGANPGDLLGHVGIVFSTPANQLSSSKPNVREELAFGLENLAVPRAGMDARIDAVMDRLGIGHLADREPLTLSGGEQQRVAIASIVVMGPGLLILDEPTARLDPAGTSAVAALLGALADAGTAVLVTSHDPAVLGGTDRCLVLDAGRIVTDGLPVEAIATYRARFESDDAAEDAPIWSPIRERPPVRVSVESLGHRYPGGAEAVRDVSLTFEPGSAVAIVGQNGSGKTTLVKHLDGLLRPTTGRVLLDGQPTATTPIDTLAATVGLVFQDPDDQLFERTVEREVGFGPRNLHLSDAEAHVERALAAVGLLGDRGTNPYDLDLSQRKLVALAGILAMDPAVVVLDEPTTGQDPAGVARIGRIVAALTTAGRTVIAITHDLEFAAAAFERVVVMRTGEVILDGSPARVFDPANAAVLASTGLTATPTTR
jgi:energy-coupling factor transport system ATP-binding protein